MPGDVKGLEDARRAERSVLGCLLRWNAAIADVAAVLRAEDFSVWAHRTIYAAVVGLFEVGHPVDLPILADALNKSGRVEDVGGYAYLGELWDAVATGANAAYYAGIVREHSVCRQLVEAGTEIVRDAHDRTDSPEALLEQAERKVFRIAQVGIQGSCVPLSSALNDLYTRIDATQERGGLPGVRTGFLDLDEKLAGLQNSDLVIVAARPGGGKTAMGLHLARHAAVKEGVPVFFVSLEMARVDLAERLLCAQGRVNGHHLRKGCLSGEERDRLVSAGGVLSKAPIFIDDTPCQTVLRITANARRLRLKHGIGLVVVDYVQLVEPDDRRLHRYEQLGGVSRRLKFLARDLHVPVVAMAQLNRSSDGCDRPRLSQLRESGNLEQDSDVVLMLHAPEDCGTVEVIVAKQRNGPTGDVTLTFEKQYQSFGNFAVGSPFAGVG